MISIHYTTTAMHCKQNTNNTRHHTPHNRANHRKTASTTQHSTTRRNRITSQTPCRRWIRASLMRSQTKASSRITPSRQRVWIRTSFTATTITKWIIMITVMMTYWHLTITITIKRKTIERVESRGDNPTLSASNLCNKKKVKISALGWQWKLSSVLCCCH